MKVVFIPGLLCTNLIWGSVNNIRNKYSCHDADVIGFDSIEKMSDALVSSINSDDITLIGISMGGYVAIDAALKLKNKLKKLILINTTSNAVNQVSIPDREKAIKLAAQGAFEKVIAMANGICYYQPQIKWILLEEKMAHEVGSSAFVKQQKAIMTRKNYSPLIKNIKTDTLIISGKNDKVIPFKDSIFMSEQIKNSSLILLDKCGHLSTLEKGHTVASFIEQFLEA